MKIYLLIHVVDGDSWGVDTDAFLSKEEAQKSMRNFWQTALKEWGIDAESEQNDERVVGNIQIIHIHINASVGDDGLNHSFMHLDCDLDIHVLLMNFPMLELVLAVVANACADIAAFPDPDEGEQDEADKLEKEFNELSNQPGWGDVW